MESDGEGEGDELGVIEPLRLPPFLVAGPGRVPWLAWLFIALAVLDIVGRAILDPSSPLAVGDLGLLMLTLLRHDLPILLPAVILVRRTDAAASMPAIFRGAALVAVVELLAGPLADLAHQPMFDADGMLTAIPYQGALIDLGAAVLAAAGWILVARGLGKLQRARPAGARVTVARVLTAVVAAALVINMAASIASLPAASDAGFDRLVVSVIWLPIGPLYAIAWAFLIWTLVRGDGDPGRPRSATLVGATAGLLATLNFLYSAVVGFVLVGSDPAALSDLFASPYYEPLVIVLTTGPIALLVLAFAMGLADPRRSPQTLAPAASPILAG